MIIRIYSPDSKTRKDFYIKTLRRAHRLVSKLKSTGLIAVLIGSL